MKKRINLLILLTVLMTALFFGCANSVQNNSETSNPFVGSWVCQSQIEGYYFKYVFDDRTVTTYISQNGITWQPGVSLGYSWSGNSFQIMNGYSGYIRNGTLYLQTGGTTGDVAFSKQ